MSGFDPEQITFFAKTDARGQQVPFGIKAKDRTKHVYVIGKTGMGKSTLLENMAVQDIKNGNGLAFIDPHGATAETLLEYIPEERVKDVLYFAPFDTANPISFNVMEDVGPDKRHLVVSGLMSVFKKIWVDAWSARMEYILSNTLLALLEYPDSTLLGVNRMLSDKHYRKKVVENIKDPAVKSFWVDEFANYNERYMQEAGDAIKNKIGQFTSNPLIRNIVGQPHSSFDLRQVMDGKKILIANLSKGLVGESNANLLGSMLTTRLYLAAMSRADLSASELKEMPNFYFYVDEFQSFANATFADILSEARKYKLNLTIAHQYIEQMEEEVRNAVFGNVGTIISFRVGPFDAEVLETVFTPKFLAADIVNLGFAQIYLSLMIDGIGSQPFSAVTLPPIAPPHVSYKEMAIAESRRQFAGVRQAVEDAINAWHAESHVEPRPMREPASSGNGQSARTSAQTGGNGYAKASGQNGTAIAPRPGTPVRERALSREVREVVSATAQPPRTEVPKRADAPSDTLRASTEARAPRSSRDARERTERVERPVRPERAIGAPARERAPQKSLSDLRSVLRAMTAEGKKETGPQGVEAAVPVHGTAEPGGAEARESLKAALASAIGQPLPDARPRGARIPSSAGMVSPEEVVVAPKVAPPGAPSTGPVAPLAAPVPPVPQPNPYAEMKGKRDPLAPKQLERMMRVTGSDRNPFRP
jgi:energy-coupling factor transporter ATP-binding protein EcfA2